MNPAKMLLLAVLVGTTACPFLRPEECDVTTTSGGVECELEDNGRYACTCETGRTFVSDDFCALSPEDQDVNATCVGDGFCIDINDCAAGDVCDSSRCVSGEGEGEDTESPAFG